MSYILIKNMEMPKNCANCPLSRSGCSAVLKRANALETMVWIPWDYRHDDCPLVEVPSSDVTELKNGKWSDKQVAYIDEYGDLHFGYKCSACGAILNKTNYCGACGAKMRETDE